MRKQPHTPHPHGFPVATEAADCATYARWPTAKVRLGHRVNANTHKPVRFTSGTNARIVHHRLRPALCRIFATGTATMMINRSGIPRGITQCHSGGIALQNQNWSQKKLHFFPLHVFVTCGWPCKAKPVIHNSRVSPYRPDRVIYFSSCRCLRFAERTVMERRRDDDSLFRLDVGRADHFAHGGNGPTVFAHAYKLGLEASSRSARTRAAVQATRGRLKMKNSNTPAVKREEEGDWEKHRWR
jgi:hypothetical protein